MPSHSTYVCVVFFRLCSIIIADYNSLIHTVLNAAALRCDGLSAQYLQKLSLILPCGVVPLTIRGPGVRLRYLLARMQRSPVAF